MSVIELSNDLVSLKAGADETVLEATLNAGIPHAHACGGHGLCSSCRVYVDEGLEHVAPRNEAEQKLADQLGLLPEVRLTCRPNLMEM